MKTILAVFSSLGLSCVLLLLLGLLTYLGTIPIASASTTKTKAFPVAPAYGGNLPPYVRIIVKNDLGVALTSGSINTSEISATVA